jgi:transketolase
MRKAFIQTLVELAKKDSRIMLLTGDLGFMVVEPFVEQFPDRFFNVGVAEQNLIGIATGLAEGGFIPFVYSIVTFAVLRSYEFLRNGPIFHQLPVRLVGIGGGIEYSNNGATHWGLEDIGVLRVQPGLQIITPADSKQASAAIKATWNLPGPVYYRLGKNDATIVPGLNGKFEMDRLQIVREGGDILFLTVGNIAVEAFSAAEEITSQNLHAAVGIVSSLNPAPIADLIQILKRYPLVITVEAHFINGGLGSLVAEIIAENQINTRLIRQGIKDLPDGISGSQKYLYQKFGISREALVKTVFSEIKRV